PFIPSLSLHAALPILFSKPSPFSFEKGMFAGSAHTLNDVRSTRSTRTPSAARALPPIVQPNDTPSVVTRLIVTKTALFIFSGRVGFISPLRSEEHTSELQSR